MLTVNSSIRLLMLLTLCLSLVAIAHAQSATATLSGTVEDTNGALVPGATVRVTNPATGLQRQATTNDNGTFTIPLLPPSSYNVSVEHQGFAPAEIKDVVLNVNDNRSLQIQLKVGQIGGEIVNVNSGANTIREDPAVAIVVDRQFVGNMPLNGRSFQSLIELTPGTVLTRSNFGEQGQFSVNGQRADANYFTVDGVSANIGVSAGASSGQSGGGSLPGLSALGGTNNLVSVDALQEFKIQTSTYAPEFGRTPGGQVQIVTRSGTNEFRGALFEYFRNDVFDANDWFANSRRLKRPALRQNDFGGVLGGPILLPRFGEGGPTFLDGRNRSFFFFSYEGLRLRQPQVAITQVPSLSARASAPAQIRPFLNAFPLPNGRDLGSGLAEFSASYSNPATLDATSIRVDHTFNEKLTLFGRYNYAPSESVQRGGGIASLNSLNPTALKTQTFTAAATLVPTSNVSNDFRFNYSRNTGANLLSIDNFGGAVPLPDSLLFPSPFSSQNALFNFALLGGALQSYSVGKNVDNLQRQINAVDNLSMVLGAHQMKLGIDYRKLSPFLGPRNYAQVARFDDVAAALTGRVSSVLLFSSVPVTLSFTNLSTYVQDTWKVTRGLTFTYGLRWELNPPPSGEKGKEPLAVTGTDNLATLAFASQGTPLWKTTYNNFAPRFGVAYQLSQTQGRETVLRGGFGIFHDMGTQSAGNLANTGGRHSECLKLSLISHSH